MTHHTDQEIEDRFWKALRKDMTVMLGLPGKAQGRPMTAQMRDKENHGPIYFFTSSETELAERLSPGDRAELAFASKGHEVFATAHGRLSVETDRAVIDALWNPYVAAWFEGGKDDPRLRLLRFDGEAAEVWLDASSLLAGLKMLLGAGDPKKDYEDNVAKVRIG